MDKFFKRLKEVRFINLNKIKNPVNKHYKHYYKKLGGFSIEIYQDNEEIVNFVYSYTAGDSYLMLRKQEFKEHIDTMCDTSNTIENILISVGNGGIGEMMVKGLLNKKNNVDS